MPETPARLARHDECALLLRTIAVHAGSLAFTTQELFAHAEQVPELHRQLDALTRMRGRSAGKLFRRIEGADLEGYAIARVGEASEGLIWRVHQTRAKPMLAIA